MHGDTEAKGWLWVQWTILGPWDIGHHEAIALNRKGKPDLNGDTSMVGTDTYCGLERTVHTWSLSPTCMERLELKNLGRGQSRLRRMTS